MIRNLKEKAVSWLRWSEKYTKTDMVYFFKGNFWLNVNRGVSVLNGLILSVAFAHLLSKEAYGTYTFALAVIGLFSMPQTTGLASGVGKGVARGEHAIVFEGLKRIFPWSLGGSVLLAIIGGYYFFSGNMLLGLIFLLGAATLTFSVSTGISKSFFSFKGDFERLTRFNLLRTPIMTLALVAAAYLTQSALWVVAANIVGSLILSALLYRIMLREYSFDKTIERREHFAGRFAFHSGVLSIFSYLSDQLDDILLWKFAGAAPVAIYTYAVAPVRELRSLIENQSALAMPKFARKEFHEVRANLLFRIRQMYWIAVPLVAIYIVAAPFIFKFLFPQYLAAVVLSQIASISLLSAPRRLMSVAISAHQKIKESYIMTVLPNAVRIVLALIFIPLWSINGAVAALLISEVIDYGILGTLMASFKGDAKKHLDDQP